MLTTATVMSAAAIWSKRMVRPKARAIGRYGEQAPRVQRLRAGLGLA